jgi:hypothetical protein
MAIICGIIWGVLEWVIPVFSFNLLLAPAAGYVIGEVISLSVNRKRGIRLAIVGGMAVVASYFLNLWFLSLLSGIPFYTGLPFGLLSIVYHLVALALGIFVAVMRLR